MEVRYADAAREEGFAAAAWYGEQQGDLQTRFLEKWKDAENRFVANPEIHRSFEGGLRKCRFCSLSLRPDIPHPVLRTASPRRHAHEPPARLLESEGRELDIATKAYGILIGRTWQCESATELKALRRRNGGFHPPQSYRYVGSEELMKLMD